MRRVKKDRYGGRVELALLNLKCNLLGLKLHGAMEMEREAVF